VGARLYVKPKLSFDGLASSGVDGESNGTVPAVQVVEIRIVTAKMVGRDAFTP
jgi:hypothetical protein